MTHISEIPSRKRSLETPTAGARSRVWALRDSRYVVVARELRVVGVQNRGLKQLPLFCAEIACTMTEPHIDLKMILDT